MTTLAKNFRHVGKSPQRREGVDKVTGRARYVDDFKVANCLHGRTVRSTIAKGRVRSISYGPGVPWDEVVVATAADLPVNVVALIVDDQPALVDKEVRHPAEPIVLVAHADPAIATAAAKAIRIEYDEDPAPAFAIGEGPLMKEYLIEEGDPDAALAGCDVVVEGVWETGAQEHVYIEPNGFVAWWEGDRVVLHGSHQCPYYVHKAIKTAFALERDDQVDVTQETTGGAFGGKEDFPSVVAIHAALLARKAGRPVRLIYDRHEDMASTTKRHPSRTRLRLGARRDGRLVALDMVFEIDGGAYVTLSPVVLSRGIIHGSGPYRWPAARLRGRCYYTNSVPYGAFRGFGAPQSQFAIEAAMNELADQLGMDPAELRRINFLKKGDTLPTGQVLDTEPHLGEMLDRALAMSNWSARRAAAAGTGRAVGLSTFLHGTGFTGSGEVYLKSRAAVASRADGKVEIRVSTTEMGQGTETIFPQIAAEALGIELEDAIFVRPQTSKVPNSGPTVASRTCSVVGRLVQRAAEGLRERLAGRSVAAAHAAEGEIAVEVIYEPPPGLYWDDATYRGSAYGAYSWGVNVAEVSVDPVTMHPTVHDFWAVFDIGTVVNPVLALGQAEGGIAQGIGWATCEKVTLRRGLMANGQMTNYIIPTSADIPGIHVEFFENPYPYGAFGSKGLGELPMDGPGPAILAAINHAAGASLRHIPIQSEDLLHE